jgi:hypothetical protein
VAFDQGRAVDAGLSGERDDGQGTVGGDGLACEETLGGGADTGSLVLVPAGSCQGLSRLGSGVVGVGGGPVAVGGSAELVPTSTQLRRISVGSFVRTTGTP